MSNAARKLVTASLAGALVALSACSSVGGAPAENQNTEKPESISYWSMWKEGETQQKVLAEAVESWEAESGIKVNVEWQGRGVTQKLTPALNTNNVPDIVDASYNAIAPILLATNNAGSMKSAYDSEVDGQKVSELIPAKYMTDATKLTLENGEPWMVPYSISSTGVWFDKAKNPDWASNPPQTWDDFMTHLDKAEKDGDVPIALDGDIAGYNAFWFSTLMIEENGPGSLDELFASKDGSAWDAPEVTEIAKRVETLAKGDYFIPGYDASKWPAQQQAWGAHKADLLFGGSYLPAETSTYAAKGFEFDSFPLPTNTDKKYARAEFTGFVTPVRSKNHEWASKFAAHVLSKSVQDAWGAEAKQIPIRQDAETSTELNSVIENLKNADAVYPAMDGVLYPSYADKVFNPIDNELVLGKISGEKFVSKMKQATIDYWENQ